MAAQMPRVGAVTDRGLEREGNEDAYGYRVPTDPQVLKTKGSLYVVADGMGGYRAGEVASELAVRRIIQAYYAHPGPDAAEALRAAFLDAHYAIREQAVQQQAPGMGTTAVAAVVLGDYLLIANVGDSLAFYLHDGEVEQLAEDHSWVALAVKQGLLTPEEAARHPNRNVITRSLGMEKEPEVFVSEPIRVRAGDAIILCTDGLSGLVAPGELATVREEGEADPQRVAERLLAMALERGAPDNVTALVLQFGAAARIPAVQGLKSLLMSPRFAAALGVGVMLTVLMVGLLVLHRSSDRSNPWRVAYAGTSTALAETQHGLETATAQGTEVAGQLATIRAHQTAWPQTATSAAQPTETATTEVTPSPVPTSPPTPSPPGIIPTLPRSPTVPTPSPTSPTITPSPTPRPTRTDTPTPTPPPTDTPTPTPPPTDTPTPTPTDTPTATPTATPAPTATPTTRTPGPPPKTPTPEPLVPLGESFIPPARSTMGKLVLYAGGKRLR